MKCPFCQDYSMTYDLERHQYTCHTYSAVINAETMPYDRSSPLLRAVNNTWGLWRTLEQVLS